MSERKTFVITVCLNMKLMPRDRHGLEDAFEYALEKTEAGYLGDGGGTYTSKEGEVLKCDFDIEIYRDVCDNDIEKAFDIAENIANIFKISKGSSLVYNIDADNNTERSIGITEGMAVYLNGTDLPDEVYESCNPDYVIDKIEECLEDKGEFISYWQGSSETALYFYGTSFEEMKNSIKAFVEEYPLCQKCRIVQTA